MCPLWVWQSDESTAWAATLLVQNLKSAEEMAFILSSNPSDKHKSYNFDSVWLSFLACTKIFIHCCWFVAFSLVTDHKKMTSVSQKMDLPEVQSHHQEAHWRPWCHDGWSCACRTYADTANPLQHQSQSCTSRAIQGFSHSSLQKFDLCCHNVSGKFSPYLNNTTDWNSVYHATLMLEFRLRRIQISGIIHSRRSIQEDMMCLGGIHVPESPVRPGTLFPSVHWACLLPASLQLHIGHQTGRPCILLHSLLFPPSYL